METITQEQVDAALDIAVKENGYTELATWIDIRVASDLVECNKEFEDFSPARLRPYVWNWQQRNGGERVEIKWPTGPHTGETLYVPKSALAFTEAALIKRLETQLREELDRANANAMQTWKLGRHLSIAVKALQGMRGVMVAVMKLRRMDQPDNPISAAMPGYICLQDGKELDIAVEAASKGMEQLEKEYPNEAGPAPKAERTYTHGIHEANCSCGGLGCTKCAPPEHR